MPVSVNFEEGTTVRLMSVQSHIMQMDYIYFFLLYENIYNTIQSAPVPHRE